jgi:hypothetical protein
MIDSDMSFEGRLSAAALQHRMNIVAFAQVAPGACIVVAFEYNLQLQLQLRNQEPRGEGDRRVMSC